MVQPVNAFQQGQRAFGGGLQQVAALGQLQQQTQQRQQQQAQKAQQQQFYGALREAATSGDYSGISQQYPQYIDQIKKAQDYQTGLKQAGAEKFLGQAYGALDRGDTEGLTRIIEQNRDVIDQIGDPSFTAETALQMAQENPESLKKIIKGSYQLSGGDIEKLGITDPVLQQMGTGAMSGYSYDPATGQFTIQDDIKKLLTDEAAKKAEQGKKLEFKDVKDLQDKVTSLTKDASATKIAADQLATLGKLKNPAAQTALLTKFMKTLDPASTVTATEQGMVANASGPAEAIAGLINKVTGQGPLSEDVINDIIVTGQSLANDAIRGSDTAVREYMDVYGHTVDDETKEKLFQRIPKLLEVTGATPETPTEPQQTAPPAAIAHLRANPELIDQFEQYYGYRPEGI